MVKRSTWIAREKDLNPIDQQNFDVVTRITSTSVLNILENHPDATGTRLFLKYDQTCH